MKFSLSPSFIRVDIRAKVDEYTFNESVMAAVAHLEECTYEFVAVEQRHAFTLFIQAGANNTLNDLTTLMQNLEKLDSDV